MTLFLIIMIIVCTGLGAICGYKYGKIKGRIDMAEDIQNVYPKTISKEWDGDYTPMELIGTIKHLNL